MATNPRHAERETTEVADDVHNVEKLSQTWQSGSEAASRIVGRSVDQFSKMFGLSVTLPRRSHAWRARLQRPLCGLRASRVQRSFG
jgi:hypothetical protein